MKTVHLVCGNHWPVAAFSKKADATRLCDEKRNAKKSPSNADVQWEVKSLTVDPPLYMRREQKHGKR